MESRKSISEELSTQELSLLFRRFIQKDRDIKSSVKLVKDQNDKMYVKLESQVKKGGWKFVPLAKVEEILESF